MDIGSGNGWPASALSNFAPHPFALDGVRCASMEGFLQSLKFDKPAIQEAVCGLAGRAAKSRGAKRNRTWRRAQTLWWRGVAYDRHGPDYQALLDRAYAAMYAHSDAFRRALRATGNAALSHSVGRANESETVLTAREFVARLVSLRAAAAAVEG